MKILNAILAWTILSLNLAAETGEIVEEGGKFYLKDSQGKKSEILSGKKLSLQLARFSQANFKSKQYDFARNYAQSSLENMVIAREYDNDLIQENLEMLLSVEAELKDDHKIKSQYLNEQLMSKLYVSLGGTYMKAKNYQKQKQSMMKAIFYDSKNAQAYSYLGVAHDMLGEYSDAVKNYRKAISLKPKDAETHFNLACSYSLQNDVKNSLRSLETALELGFEVKNVIEDETLGNIRNSDGFKMLIKKFSK